MDIICMNGLMNKCLILGLSLATLWIKGCHRSIDYRNYFYGFRASRREWSLGRGLFAMEVISVLIYFYKRSVQPIILTNEK